MRKLLSLLGMIALAALPGAAQQVDEYPQVEFFGGYGFQKVDLPVIDSDWGHGWTVSLAGNFHRNWGIEGMISGTYGSNSDTGTVPFPAPIGAVPFDVGVDYSQHLFMVGPRIAGRYEKVTPWVHGLIGIAQFSPDLSANTFVGPIAIPTDSSSDFAWAIGGGIDVNMNDNVAIRVVQVDFIHISGPEVTVDVPLPFGLAPQPISFGETSQNIKLAFGVVFKWGQK